ncbi:MAG: hypothetical protein HY817_00600 [Candidatus Abawacabacteria bacterium]|nr:hypothetical protein [Candidatus Abawacabacteria bacterium]
MYLLTILSSLAVLVLFAVHSLSAVQLYKQKALGPHAVPSIIVFSGLWVLGFIAALINFIAYLSTIS